MSRGLLGMLVLLAAPFVGIAVYRLVMRLAPHA